MKKFNLLLLGAILTSVGYSQTASNLRFGANALKQGAGSLFRQSGQPFTGSRGFNVTPTFGKRVQLANPLSPNKLNAPNISRFYSNYTNQGVKPGYFTTYWNRLKNSQSMQRINKWFRQNQAPIITTTGLGLTGATASTAAYNILHPGIVLAEEQSPAQKEIETIFTRAQLNENADSKLLEDWAKLAWSLFGEKNLTEANKKRFAQASAKIFDASRAEWEKMFNDGLKRGLEPIGIPGYIIETYLLLINLASGGPIELPEFGSPTFGHHLDQLYANPNFPGPEHLNPEKGFYIPTAIVAFLKSQTNMKETLNTYKEKLLDPEARNRNSGKDEVLPVRVQWIYNREGELETDSPIVQKRIALIDALIDLVEKPINTYEEEPGLIRYQTNKYASSWIPWHWLGY